MTRKKEDKEVVGGVENKSVDGEAVKKAKGERAAGRGLAKALLVEGSPRGSKKDDLKGVKEGYEGKVDSIRHGYEEPLSNPWNISDQAIDQILYRIEDTGIKPTQDQIEKIARFLMVKLTDSDDTLAYDAEKMGFGINNGKSARNVFEGQLKRLRELAGPLPEDKKILESQLKERGAAAFDRLIDTVEHGFPVGDGFSRRTKDLDEQIYNVEYALVDRGQMVSYLSKKDIDALGKILPHLKKIKTITEDTEYKINGMSRMDTKAIAEVRRDERKAVEKILRTMKSDVAVLRKDMNKWLGEQIKEGNLIVAGDKITASRKAGKGELSGLGEAAVERAGKKKAEELFGLSKEEQGLHGEERKLMVEKKRKEVLEKMKDEIRGAVSSKQEKKLGNVFRSMLAGENDLSENEGEKVPNREFLKDVFSDVEFIRSLVGSKERHGKDAMSKEAMFVELCNIYRDLFPDQPDKFLASKADAVLVSDFEAEAEESKTKGRNEPIDEYFSWQTSHLRLVRTILEQRLGIAVGKLSDLDYFKQVQSDPSMLEKINITALCELGFDGHRDNRDELGNDLLELYRAAHGANGEEILRQRLEGEVFFPALAGSEMHTSHVGGRDEENFFGKPENVVASGLKFAKRTGLVDFKGAVQVLKRAKAAVDGMENPRELRREIQFFTDARNSAFSEEIEALIEAAA